MIKDICSLFDIEGDYVSYRIIKDGNINSTYKVEFINNDKKEYYIIQCINNFVFKDPIEVMENIFYVTNYIKLKMSSEGLDYKNRVLTYKMSKDNKSYVCKNGSYWRCYEYIKDSITFNVTNNLEVIEESALAFGEFSKYLSDFNVDKLNVVIENFHNPKIRYKNLKDIIYQDEFDRVGKSSDLIEEYLLLEELACQMATMVEEKKLPFRVVHNDTKCNNVLFDSKSFKHLAVIDLDTVMPGLIGYDYGDAIRFIANNSKEDEEDVSKVYLDLNKFEAFTKGYLKVLNQTLTIEEKETLVLACITISIELGVRFLTDYLQGDKYFKITSYNHNLVRSRCQLVLAKDMLKKRKEMEEIVRKYL